MKTKRRFHTEVRHWGDLDGATVSPEDQLERAKATDEFLCGEERRRKLAPGTLQRRPEDPTFNPLNLPFPRIREPEKPLTPMVRGCDESLHPVRADEIPINEDISLEPPGGQETTIAIADNIWRDATKAMGVIVRSYWDRVVAINQDELLETVETVTRIQNQMALLQMRHQHIKHNAARRAHRATGRPVGRPRKVEITTKTQGLFLEQQTTEITEVEPHKK